MLQVSTKVEQNAVVLELSGRFDFHVMEQFLSTLEHAESTHLPGHVILDLSQVSFIDSMAIGRLVTTYQRLHEAAIRFTLVGQHGEVDTTLKGIDFEGIVPTVSTVKDALAFPPLQPSQKGAPMTELDPDLSHITMTETMLRFYVFLGQYIDRCLDAEHRRSLPEQEFQQHLGTTHDQVVELLATNRVVKDKAEVEFQQVTAMCQKYLKDPVNADQSRVLHKEREILRVKMLTLSDLLAVFRSV